MEELRQQLNELLAWKKSLEMSATIPLPIDQAFRARLGINGTTTSTKVSTSEDQAVNEAGSATYNVLKSPDGFAKVVLENGNTVYLPYYD